MVSSFRKKRFDSFLSVMKVKPTDAILDVGGLPHTWMGSGFENQVTLLNLDIPNDQTKGFKYHQGDARDLSSIQDNAFDIVFSNSVIEHVGGLKEQRKMANEIRRVARKYWIQTPNKHFPIEIHFLFPFFQYLPHRIRHVVAGYWPFSYAKMFGLDPIYQADHIWLLDTSNMRDLFPDADLRYERIAGLTKSIIATKK